jgi:hypothetical protein
MAPPTTFLALCGFAAVSSAHMLLSTPAPYSSPALHNGPLAPDGSEYPCQIRAGTTPSGSATTMPLGSDQSLQFTGQATHGGGSCQISLTYDFPPTKDSVFKVIHSIQGGCPAKNTPGNMGNSASAADPFGYSFKIPSNIPTCDNCTISWSWVNKIGNREFYHNCAPVKLIGNGGSKSNFDALPDMFIANVEPNAGCKTVEGYDVLYPNPGASVDNFGTNLSPNGLTGTCSSPAGGASAGSSGTSSSGSSGSAASSPASAPSSAPPSQASSPAAGNSPGVFATVPTDGAGAGAAESTPAAVSSATSPAAVPAAASATAAPPPPPPVASPAPAAGSSSSGSGAAGGSGGSSVAGAQKAGSACSTEGQFVCLGTSYQQCGSGTWTPVMALAAGTSCTGGSGATLNIVAAGGKTRRIAQRFHS